MATFDILRYLPPAAVDAFVAAAQVRHVPARGLIYQQSQDGDEFFRILSGSVRLSVMGVDGRELLYQLFTPGDCFGTSSVVDGEPRPQTAEAFEAADIQVLDRAAIDRLRRDHPAMNDALLKLLSRHMRLLSTHFAAATMDEVSFRLARRLVELAEGFGAAGADGIALTTRLSQSELASMVGTARQTVNRLLQDFQERGWVSIRAGVITLVDLPALRATGRNGTTLGGRA